MVQQIVLTTTKSWTDITDMINVPYGFTGLALIQSTHTTCSVRIYEPELLLLSDVQKFIESLIPKQGDYRHDYVDLRQVPREERINGYAHLRSLLFNTSEIIPVIDGVLQLGQWQRLFVVELDGERERTINIMLISE